MSGLSLARRFRWGSWACSVALGHRHHQERTQGGKCVGETWSTGVSAGQLGDLQATHSGPASGWSPHPGCALSRSCHSLSFPAPCHGAHSLGLRMTGERTEPPLAASCTAGEAGSSLTWSHFPPQEKPWDLEGLSQLPPREKDDAGNSSWPSSPLQCMQTQNCCSSGMLERALWDQDFRKFSLSHPWLSV